MITNGDWAGGTDPFVLALAASWGAATITTATPQSIDVLAKGPINGVWDDPDTQEVYLQSLSDATVRVPVECSRVDSANIQTAGNAGADFGPEYRTEGGVAYKWDVFDKMTAQDVANDKLFAYFDFNIPAQSSPANFGLYCKTGYVWRQKDPAQVLASMLIWYSNDPLARDWLCKASIQAASDFYDVAPCRMDVMRKVGQSLLDQVVALFDQTSDMLCVRPADADGKYQLHVALRRELEDCPSVVDLDDPAWGVIEYTLRPTDQHTVERLEVEWGDFLRRSTTVQVASQYETGFPMKLGNGQDREVQWIYTLDNARRQAVQAPNLCHRADVLRHQDLGHWRDDQQELTIRMGARHMNFAAGKKMHVVGRRIPGVVATDDWLVAEVDEGFDDLTATLTLVRVRHAVGKISTQLGVPTLFEFTEQTLQPWQRRPDPPYSLLAQDTWPRPGDRWEDQGPASHHATEFAAGTGGPGGGPPASPRIIQNAISAWPGVYFGNQITRERWLDIETRAGLREITGFNEAANDWVFFFVVRADPALSAPEQWLFNNGTGIIIKFYNGTGKYAFNDGSGSGDQATTAGASSGNQLLTFVLRAGANAAKIRKNGADLQAGLNYVQKGLGQYASIGGDRLAALYGFGGYMVRAMATKGDPGDTLIAAHEAFLMDRYGL